MTAGTPGQAAYEAYVTFVGLPLSDWPWEDDDVNQAVWDGVASAVATAQQPKPARADEFARMKVKLSALIASMQDTVRPRPDDLHDSMSREFDDGAVHATAVNLRQLRAILDETALTAGEPKPAPELAALADDLDRLAGEHMRKADQYDRDAKPAPELRAAMAETRTVLGYLDDFTHAVIDLDAGFGGKLAKAATALRKKAGLTDIELLQILTEGQQKVLKYALRAERHPDNPGRKADEE